MVGTWHLALPDEARHGALCGRRNKGKKRERERHSVFPPLHPAASSTPPRPSLCPFVAASQAPFAMHVPSTPSPILRSPHHRPHSETHRVGEVFSWCYYTIIPRGLYSLNYTTGASMMYLPTGISTYIYLLRVEHQQMVSLDDGTNHAI